MVVGWVHLARCWKYAARLSAARSTWRGRRLATVLVVSRGASRGARVSSLRSRTPKVTSTSTSTSPSTSTSTALRPLGVFLAAGGYCLKPQSRFYMRLPGQTLLRRLNTALDWRCNLAQPTFKRRQEEGKQALCALFAVLKQSEVRRFKRRRLVRFSRLARALFSPLTGCPTRENRRGTAPGLFTRCI